jgi:hypothetical protein
MKDPVDRKISGVFFYPLVSVVSLSASGGILIPPGSTDNEGPRNDSLTAPD